MISNFDLMEAVLADQDRLAEHWNHPRWPVRYAAAVAMGESGEQRWLPVLKQIMQIEAARDLYGQPRVVGFAGSADDTSMAEQLVAIEVEFDAAYPPELLDAWRCRGRVRQACILAVHAIGAADDEWRDMLHEVLRNEREDFAVKAAAAKALARVGSPQSVEHLQYALTLDEWCLTVEARKALERWGAPHA